VPLPDPNADDETFDVIILTFEPRAEPPEVGLQRLFGVDREAAEVLLRELPATVRRGVNRVRSEYFRRALVSIGAHVEVRDRLGRLSAPSKPPKADRALPPSAANGEPAAPAMADALSPIMFAAADAPPTSAAPPGLRSNAGAVWGELERSSSAEARRKQLQAKSGPLVAPSLPILSNAAVHSLQPSAAGDSQRSAHGVLELESMQPANDAAKRAIPAPQPRTSDTDALSSQRAPIAAPPRAAPTVPAHAREIIDDGSFWDGIPDALQFPWLGKGLVWFIAIGACAISLNLLAGLTRSLPLLAALLSVVGNACVLGLCAEYHRRCLTAVSEADTELDDGPAFDSAQVLNVYLRAGLQLALFAFVLQLPLVVWLGHRALVSSANDALRGLGSPLFWLLACVPGIYWPMALALVAQREPGDAKAFLQLASGLRAIGRAPFEYLSIVGLGALTFAFPWLACVIAGKAAGLPTAFFAAAAGLPLAASHAVMGALTGELMRTRPDVFE
jgi:hypothetical protein